MKKTQIALLLAVFGCASWAQSSTQGWHYIKDDPATKHHLLTVSSDRFRIGKQPHTFELEGVTVRVYTRNGAGYRVIRSDKAIVDENGHTLTYGPRLSKTIAF